MPDYVLIYLFGCAVVFVLLMFNTALISFLRWFTKANVVYKNLAKIEPPDETTFKQRAISYTVTTLFETMLSWLNVPLQIWVTIRTVLTTLREVFTETPEAIKELRFPLKTNPNMLPEEVWAYVMAVQTKTDGRQLFPSALEESLNDVKENYPSFYREHAVKILATLEVYSDNTISALLHNLANPDKEE